MVCLDCGTEMPKDAKFCSACGKAVTTTKDARLLGRLIAAEPHTLNGLLAGREDMYKAGAVYILSTPDDSEVVYVGQSGQFRERMRFHVGYLGAADLAHMVTLLPDGYDRNPGNYLVRYVPQATIGSAYGGVASEESQRKRLEDYVKAGFNPRLNKR